MLSRIGFLLVTLTLVSGSFAQSAPPADSAVASLSKAGVFAFGGVGFFGVMSHGEKDYREVLARPSALQDFEKVFATGTLPAKAYALVGIRTLDPDRFKELAASWHDDSSRMMTAHGCIFTKERFAAVLKGIAAGDFSSGDRSDTSQSPKSDSKQ